jgi:hypothetical protein
LTQLRHRGSLKHNSSDGPPDVFQVSSADSYTAAFGALGAIMKRILKLGRLRLRGPRGAQDEFVLAAIAQNLRRLALLVARPPPAQALCIA